MTPSEAVAIGTGTRAGASCLDADLGSATMSPTWYPASRSASIVVAPEASSASIDLATVLAPSVVLPVRSSSGGGRVLGRAYLPIVGLSHAQ